MRTTTGRPQNQIFCSTVMNISYHYAQTQDELEAIYRLRYEIYVEEMHIFGDVADHAKRMLYGPN